MKIPKTTFFIIFIIAAVLISTIVVLFWPEISECPLCGNKGNDSSNNQSEAEKWGKDLEGKEEEIAKTIMVPQSFVAYQDYVRTVSRRKEGGYVAKIEGEIAALATNEKCPYNEIPCGIEPYPDDSGKVKITKIISCGGYPKPSSIFPDESGENENLTLDVDCKTLQAAQGEEIGAYFLFSARPAKIMLAKIGAKKGSGSESGLVPAFKLDNSSFFPIEKKDGYLIFIAEVSFFQDESFSSLIEEKLVLPGLKAGDKFSAEVYFDGSLHLDEYSVLQK